MKKKLIQAIKNEYDLVSEIVFRQKSDKSRPKSQLDNSDSVVFNQKVYIKEPREFQCLECSMLFSKRPNVLWRINRNYNRWHGRCSCGKKYQSKTFK